MLPGHTITNGELDRRFDYHPPSSPEVAERHEKIRAICRGAAEEIIEVTGAPSPEQSLAIRDLETSMFWANAAIAREITNIT